VFATESQTRAAFILIPSATVPNCLRSVLTYVLGIIELGKACSQLAASEQQRQMLPIGASQFRPKRASPVSSLRFCIRFHFILAPEIMYDFSTAKDQDDIIIEGDVHGYTLGKECEKGTGPAAREGTDAFTVPMEGLTRFMELNADRNSTRIQVCAEASPLRLPQPRRSKDDGIYLRRDAPRHLANQGH
jgi:hypothetical protein